MRTRKLILLLMLFSLNGCGGCVNIWKAVEKEDLDSIARYAKYGGNLNTGATFYGVTPLYHALKKGKKESYLKLLELGANPNTLCRYHGTTVLHEALDENDTFWLEEGLKSGGNPNLVNTHAPKYRRYSLLSGAASDLHRTHSDHKINQIRILLKAGADIDKINIYQQTVLHETLETWNFKTALYLLENGADYLKKAPKDQSAIQVIRSRINYFKERPPRRHEDLEFITKIHEFLKKDGFDPMTAVWDERDLIWKQP